MLFTNRTESYNRAYAYGEYKMRNSNERLTFGITEDVDASGAPTYKVDLYAHVYGITRHIGFESVPTWFDEPGTLGYGRE